MRLLAFCVMANDHAATLKIYDDRGGFVAESPLPE
jgi:hypothetical protein